MDIFFTSKLFLTLSWTFGELLVLFITRWVLFTLLREKRFYLGPFLIMCGIIFSFSIWLHLGGKIFFVHWLEEYADLGWIYSKLSWDFFCTLWAGIECFIFFYMFSLYLIIKGNLLKGLGKGEKFLMDNRLFINSGALFILFAIYVLYHYYAVNVYIEHGLDSIQLKNILYLYRRVIGVFWIVFEGAIAILLFKAYFLFKRTINTGVDYG